MAHYPFNKMLSTEPSFKYIYYIHAICVFKSLHNTQDFPLNPNNLKMHRMASRAGGAGSGVGPRSTHRDNEGSDALTDDHDHSDSMSGNSTDDDSDRSGRNKPSQRPAGRGITAQSGASSGIEHKEDPRGRGNGTTRSPGHGPGGYSPGSSPGYGPGSGPRSGGRIGKMVCDSEDFLDDDDDDDHENESPGSDDDF